MAKISISTLLDAGSHFGHQTRRWNPKMKPYIFGSRGDIYIIDLKQTLIGMDKAYTFVSELAKKGGTVLFVGTKKQAQEAVADAANRCGMPYVNARWLGGMMTNFVTIRTRVQRMEELEAMDADGRMALLPKKEQILLRKELGKLQANLNGIRNMKRTPDAVFVIDTNREEIAIREAKRLGIPVVGTLDTNCDPDDVDFGIPANDDAIRSVRMMAEFIADAVVAGIGEPVTAAEMGEVVEAEAAVEAEAEAVAE
ncbi:MAG: 30S ribosomal protein S2 [Eggerthellaceae bacterium]|nr:30S ribosomal protein S2 [Eggerthellaceae bacterium]